VPHRQEANQCDGPAHHQGDQLLGATVHLDRSGLGRLGYPTLQVYGPVSSRQQGVGAAIVGARQFGDQRRRAMAGMDPILPGSSKMPGRVAEVTASAEAAETAEAAIESFALMLRYVLQSQEESRAAKAADVTFGEEWNFVENYLELERLRLGDRLKLTTEIEPAALDYRLPAFSLQPIVENAVKYAVAPRADGGHLHISAQSDNGNLIIKVCDDGDGKSSAGGRNGSGLGLRLVRESLAARFGSSANLKIENAPGAGFKVSMTIPHTVPSEQNTGALEIEQ